MAALDGCLRQQRKIPKIMVSPSKNWRKRSDLILTIVFIHIGHKLFVNLLHELAPYENIDTYIVEKLENLLSRIRNSHLLLG